MTYISILIALLAISFSSSASVYKCKDSHGRVQFSDQPCEETGSVFKAKNKISEVKSLGPESKGSMSSNHTGYSAPTLVSPKNTEPEKDSCKYFSSTALRKLIVKDQVEIGMKAADVKKVMGQPTNINTTSRGRDRWIYRYHDRVTYPYMENGCLVSWDKH